MQTERLPYHALPREEEARVVLLQYLSFCRPPGELAYFVPLREASPILNVSYQELVRLAAQLHKQGYIILRFAQVSQGAEMTFAPSWPDTRLSWHYASLVRRCPFPSERKHPQGAPEERLLPLATNSAGEMLFLPCETELPSEWAVSNRFGPILNYRLLRRYGHFLRACFLGEESYEMLEDPDPLPGGRRLCVFAFDNSLDTRIPVVTKGVNGIDINNYTAVVWDWSGSEGSGKLASEDKVTLSSGLATSPELGTLAYEVLGYGLNGAILCRCSGLWSATLQTP